MSRYLTHQEKSDSQQYRMRDDLCTKWAQNLPTATRGRINRTCPKVKVLITLPKFCKFANFWKKWIFVCCLISCCPVKIGLKFPIYRNGKIPDANFPEIPGNSRAGVNSMWKDNQCTKLKNKFFYDLNIEYYSSNTEIQLFMLSEPKTYIEQMIYRKIAIRIHGFY